MRADHRTLGAKVDIGGVVPATRTESIRCQLSIVGVQNVNGSGGTNVPKNGRGRASFRDVNRCPTTIQTLRKRGQLTAILHRRTPRPPPERIERPECTFALRRTIAFTPIATTPEVTYPQE